MIWRTWIFRVAVVAASLWLDVNVWRRSELLQWLADPALILVIVVTAFQGYRFGTVAAGLAALYISFQSIFAPWIHWLAWIGLIASVWISSRRLFATRSTASFIILISIGTISYTIVFAMLLWFSKLLNPSGPIPDWTSWWTPMLIHLITHPLLGWGIWAMTSRNRRYLTTTASLEQPF